MKGFDAAQRAWDAMEAPEDDGQRPLNASDRRALAYIRAQAARSALAAGEPLTDEDISF